MKTAEEWHEFLKKPGAIATVMSKDWLRAGCHRCGCKVWSAASDCWVYCTGCNIGHHTAYPFTNSGDIITELDYSSAAANLKEEGR